jgi:hypothetical protein
LLKTSEQKIKRYMGNKEGVKEGEKGKEKRMRKRIKDCYKLK